MPLISQARRPIALAATLGLLASAPLSAMDSHIVGPRAMALGGAGTAATDDHNASYYNPGMYGFFSRTGDEDAKLDADPNYVGRKDWGIGLVDLSVQLELRGRLPDYIQQLESLDVGRLQNLGSASATSEDLKAAVVASTLIQQFDAHSDNVLVLANIGVLDTRVLHVGLGFRQFVEGMVSVVDLDRSNLGFGINTPSTDIVQDITASNAAPSGWTSGYTPTLITGTAYTNLQATLQTAAPSASGAAIDEAISKLDYAANQAGLTAADIAAITDVTGVLNLALSGTGDIKDNQTAVFTAGYTVAEVPLTIGYPINDHLAVGGNLKLMIGKVAGAKARMVDKIDALPDLLQNAFNDSTQTVTGGLDLGVVVRDSWYQAGLTVRNLNRPTLQGGTFLDADGEPFTVADVELDPQVSVGVALYPFETVVLTADIDLTENQTTIHTVSGRTDPAMAGVNRDLSVTYASQRLGGGIEWNVARFLALRLGASKDLAESATGTMIHGGLGLNLWAVRFDIAGSFSTETVNVDGSDMPRAASVSTGLMIDF